jgi:hypothetical protein
MNKLSPKIIPALPIATVLLTVIVLLIPVASCKKSSSKAASTSPMTGFWTYKTDPANPNNFWNCNVLFKSDGSFRMYTALSLADTAAAAAIADTSNQVVTLGNYTVSGSTVKMVLTEFGALDLNFEGSVNSSYTSFYGTGEVSSDPNSATVTWYLTKP